MGEFDTTGLSIKVGRPVTQDGAWVGTLKKEVGSYSHEISSEFGFDRASINFAVNRGDISQWLNEGLGMDIDVRGLAGEQVWNGFVDSVDINDGGRKISVGRLSDLANRIYVTYAQIIEDAIEPIVGEQISTEDANDYESQSQYGVWEKAVSAGSRTTLDAEQIRDTVLAKYAYPTTSYDISGSSDPTVILKCLGYYRFLEAFTYTNFDNDEITSDAKLKLVLAASPNRVLSTDYTEIAPSSTYALTYEDRYRTGITIAKELASFGDASDNTWVFGVYEDRVVSFNVVPGNLDYQHKRGTGSIVERFGGGPVDPWSVRPGRWLFMPDIILGGEELPIPNTRAQFYSDKRVAFIERVKYTAPQGFSIQGTRVSKGSQGLARWGLGSL